MVMTFEQLSKAEVLLKLKDALKHSMVEDIYVFGLEQWKRDEESLLNAIQSKFSACTIIVRSSATLEDTQESSMAGKFTSVLDVDSSSREAIREAVSAVIRSYEHHQMTEHEQIFVQKQTKDVSMSGVIFTRHMESLAPYYIINYDDQSGKTNFVTSGFENKTIAISRNVLPPYPEKWGSLLQAIREIEELWPYRALDIEFAVTNEKEIVIFQVRPLIVKKENNALSDQLIFNLIEDMKEKYKRYSKRIPHLAGQKTVYGDMPDWNPSEIIGDRPNTLDYTVYRFLITNNIWHEARTDLGYYDVFPGELMTSFGKKPYIDTRLSFNSLTPAGFCDETREKLVNYYIDKLSRFPHLQDKVEFDILWTCYDFSTEKKIRKALKGLLSDSETAEIIRELKTLTSGIVFDHRKIFEKNLSAIHILNQRRNHTLHSLEKDDASVWEILSGAHYILNNCRKFGTHPFSLLARVAFMAQSFLKSMTAEKIISRKTYDAILLSVETVAKKFNYDLYLYKVGRITKEDFMETYGHLRSGTYDITSARYDQLDHFFTGDDDFTTAVKEIEEEQQRFQLNKEERSNIEKALEEIGFNVSADEFIEFIIRATEYRELSKFEFTKSLSDSIELLVRAGEKLGLKRDELCHVDFNRLMSSRNPDVSDEAYIKRTLRASADRHKSERLWYDGMILPPVIRSADDFDYVEFYKAKPNFITNKRVQGEIVSLSNKSLDNLQELQNRIVLIENADPGYDWIFTKNITGLITKYGGVASHMAIRCAEFGIPAAIGCGENIYKHVLTKKTVILDCKKKKLIAEILQEV